MKKFLFLLFIVGLTKTGFAGDTITVQTFTYGSSQDSVFLFPPDTFQSEKILMYYKLKCNPAQSPACGEWDYLTYTFLYDSTGIMDSTQYLAPSFIAGGASPDSFNFNLNPGWNYQTGFQYFTVIDAVTSFDSVEVPLNGTPFTGSGPFGTFRPRSRTQYYFPASDLNGISAGNITGIRLNLLALGTPMQNLTIRLKNSSLTGLSPASYESNGGFTTVYQMNTNFATTGWNSIQFTNPFNWDGTSALVMEITFDNQNPGSNHAVEMDFSSGQDVASTGSDRGFYCYDADFTNAPAAAFAPVDSFITVSCWVFGNPSILPQNQTLFEGIDANGRRVINSHLPWSNSRVYWDAGNSGTGSYDRIDKLATDADFEGKWNHWAFTKNVATGEMKMYLNGSLWHSGTGFTRRMYGITQFKIGSNGAGNSVFYDGSVDEFQVFNTVLDSTTIQNWMYKDLDATHPFYTNLAFYYRFNEPPSSPADDAGTNGFDGFYSGTPETILLPSATLFRNFSTNNQRPHIYFEQGVYTSHLDSILVIDSVQQPPVVLIEFNNFSDPLYATDTTLVWNPYYQYSFNASGAIVDSVWVGPDQTIYLTETPYYGPSFEIINRFELGRYITPYGIGLDLGTGFTWIFDVTDYEPLLHGLKRLTAGNWQEFLDMRFDFIKGTPAREVLGVENVWVGNYGLAGFNNNVPYDTLNLSSTASQFRLKTRTTGHGFGSGLNCAEFCQRNHFVFVDGVMRFNWIPWDECGDNPLYPQGGTWVYDRAGWCPGMDVRTYDWELTPFVSPGGNPVLEYNIDTDPDGNYVLESQLISYGPKNFTLDASVERIKAPSLLDIYKRFNPVCSNPIIIIRNNGSAALTSLKINYGMEGATLAEYNWTGNLGFLQQEEVVLGSFWWTDSSNVFEVSISEPNGGTDEYLPNNRMTSAFSIPPSHQASVYVEFKTNNYFNENTVTLTNDAGDILLNRTGASANATYKDTFLLNPGCYTLKVTDTENDGLSFWANTAQGSGYLRIRKADGGGILKTFNADFGKDLSYNFSVGYYLNENPVFNAGTMDVFPNPSNGNFTLESHGRKGIPASIKIVSTDGKLLLEENFPNGLEEYGDIDLTHSKPGIYFLRISSGEETWVKKLVVVR